MPELPEVETVRRGLQSYILGCRLTAVKMNRRDLRFTINPDLRHLGQKNALVTDVQRRGKYLIIFLENQPTILIHLGMSGRLIIGETDITDGRLYHEQRLYQQHDHIIFQFDRGQVIFNDPRRFGHVDMLHKDGTHRLLDKLGPDPIIDTIGSGQLRMMFGSGRSAIKQRLLDQAVLAGVGNIYACESLFQAGIHPLRQVGRLSDQRLIKLMDAVRNVLARAIEAGGSSLRDYRTLSGAPGYFQHQFKVYDQKGRFCTVCHDGIIRRIVQNGRSTFYCPKCQR